MTKVLRQESFVQVAIWSLRGALPTEQLCEVLHNAARRSIFKSDVPVVVSSDERVIYIPLKYRLPFWKRIIKLGKRFISKVRHPLTLTALDKPFITAIVAEGIGGRTKKTCVCIMSCEPFLIGPTSRFLAFKIGPIENFHCFSL